MKLQISGKEAKKDPNEPTLTNEDVARWNGYEIPMAEEAEKVNQLQIEFTMLNGGKIKEDIMTLTKN